VHVFLVLRGFAEFFEDLGDCPRLVLGSLLRRVGYVFYFVFDCICIRSHVYLYLYVVECPGLYMYYAYGRCLY